MTTTGVMICGHGSRSEEAVSQFANLQNKLAGRFPEYPVEYGFLEFATPIIRTGLDARHGTDAGDRARGVERHAAAAVGDQDAPIRQYNRCILADR